MGRSRDASGRFVAKVAAGAVLVFALIALMVACAADPPGTEDLGSTSSPLAVAGLFPTGVDATGTPLPLGSTDPHYVLSSNDPLRPGPSALAIAPVNGWTPNTATSTWLSPQSNGGGAALDNYTYTTTFTVAGVDPTTVAISGSWACDDTCTISLNGTVVAMLAAPGWTSPTPFTIPAGSPFVMGTNTLAFVTTNSGGGATGLQVTFISAIAGGCTADNQCSSAQFCNTQTGACEGTLASGLPIPTISGHTPDLDGTCTVAVGASVCDAGVCDMLNNECGLGNGVGPCTFSNGATVCQSGECSVNGTCEPTGGCNVNGDCSAGSICGPANTCIPESDTGTGTDAESDATASLDGSEDASGLADGMTESSEDGSSGDASEVTDGAFTDAREGDAAGDSGGQAAEAGVEKELRGDGLSCSMPPSRSSDSSDAPVWIFAVAAVAVLGRKRSTRERSR